MKKYFFLFLLTNLFFTKNTFSQNEIATYFCPPCNQDCDFVAHNEPGDCGHCGMTLVKRTEAEQMALLNKTKSSKPSIAVFIHEGMEILDFAGPVEVFTASGFEVVTVGITKDPIISQRTVKITPEYSFADCPKTDMIAVFGGNGARTAENEEVQQWLQKKAEEVDFIYSVCTGAFMLGEAGLLDGLEATTFHSAIDDLQQVAPKATILRNVKYVDSGKVITAAGVSSGIDGALYVVEKVMGKEAAQATADYMEWENYPSKTGKVNKP